MKWIEYRERMLLLARIADEGLSDSGLAAHLETIATAVLPEEFQIDVDSDLIVRELCFFEIKVARKMFYQSEKTLREIGMMFEDTTPLNPPARRGGRLEIVN